MKGKEIKGTLNLLSRDTTGMLAYWSSSSLTVLSNTSSWLGPLASNSVIILQLLLLRIVESIDDAITSSPCATYLYHACKTTWLFPVMLEVMPLPMMSILVMSIILFNFTQSLLYPIVDFVKWMGNSLFN